MKYLFHKGVHTPFIKNHKTVTNADTSAAITAGAEVISDIWNLIECLFRYLFVCKILI
ncbi:hypothetical protein BT09C10_37390 [Escherichia coli]